MEKEEFFIKRIRELANLSYRRDIVTFSDFLNLNEQNIVNNRKNQIPGVVTECFGGYEQAERQMIAFHPDALAFTWEYPITCLKVEPKARKFSEDLGHRDYLGCDSKSWDRAFRDRGYPDPGSYRPGSSATTRSQIFSWRILTRIRHTAVQVVCCGQSGALSGTYSYALVTGTCSSVRLDALIALAFQASRSSMVSFIENGQVFVNGKADHFQWL